MFLTANDPNEKRDSKMKITFFKGPALTILLIGLAIRLILAPLFTYPFDMEHWAVVMQNIESGNGLYSLTGYFYTPVWGYLLGAQDLFLNCFLSLTYGNRFIDLAGVEALLFIFHTSTVTTVEYNFVMKLPLIFVDVLVGYLVYRVVLFKSKDEHKSTLAFGCWFLCPLVIYMSVVQAQFDCFSALFALMSLILLKRNYYFFAGVFFALGALLKFFPVFCILPFCAYVLKTETSPRLSIRQLFSFVLGILLTVFIIYLPLILSGTAIDSLSFIISRGSNSTLYATIRIWVPAVLLIFTVFALAFKSSSMSSAEIRNHLTLFALTLLCVATLCSSGPQYCIVYLPIMSIYAVTNDRKDLLICTLIFTIFATIAAFLNNNFSLLSTIVEYCGFWSASDLVNAMTWLDSLNFGFPVRQGMSFIVETTQLLFNLILLVLLFRCVGLFSKYEKFNQVSDRLSRFFGGEEIEKE